MSTFKVEYKFEAEDINDAMLKAYRNIYIADLDVEGMNVEAVDSAPVTVVDEFRTFGDIQTETSPTLFSRLMEDTDE